MEDNLNGVDIVIRLLKTAVPTGIAYALLADTFPETESKLTLLFMSLVAAPIIHVMIALVIASFAEGGTIIGSLFSALIGMLLLLFLFGAVSSFSKPLANGLALMAFIGWHVYYWIWPMICIVCRAGSIGMIISESVREKPNISAESAWNDDALRMQTEENLLEMKKTKTMFCPHCGRQLDENAKFCSECGARCSVSDRECAENKRQSSLN